MIEVERLSKQIDGANVLDGVSFSLPKGTITGLIGRNGAGKTTLLRSMVGILLPDAGDVRYDGKSVYTYPQVKENLLFIPDSKQVLQGYSAKQIARLYKMIYPNFAEQYLWDGMKRFKLPVDKKIRNFSKGMKALFSLLLAFATRAEGILLDEPTDGLDPIIKRQWLQMMVEEVAEQQHIVLISSHRLDELESICDRVMILKDGVIDSVTELSEVKGRYHKLQVVYETTMPETLLRLPGIYLLANTGRIYTLLIEGNVEKTLNQIKETQPLLIDELPLSLEDLFMAKLGGEELVR